MGTIYFRGKPFTLKYTFLGDHLLWGPIYFVTGQHLNLDTFDSFCREREGLVSLQPSNTPWQQVHYTKRMDLICHNNVLPWRLCNGPDPSSLWKAVSICCALRRVDRPAPPHFVFSAILDEHLHQLLEIIPLQMCEFKV